MNRRAFERRHRQAWATFCKPNAIIEIDSNAVGVAEASSGDLGFPAAVPCGARFARMVVSLGPGPGCDLWINLCEEEGRELVASFEYEPLDL
jgi:hypothetical protein